MTADDAIEIAHAARLEPTITAALRRLEPLKIFRDPDAWREWRAASGVSDELEGRLDQRLDAIGVTPALLCEMGRAFKDAGMAGDAADFIDELWWDTTYLTDVVLASTHVIEDVRSDIAAALLESMRTPEWRRARTPHQDRVHE